MDTKLLDRYISGSVLKRFERYHDVDGAPFRIGQAVIVLNNPNQDETFDSKYIGRKGTVKFLEYDGGCGQQFPFDPMIGVSFADKSEEEFWNEELMLIL